MSGEDRAGICSTCGYYAAPPVCTRCSTPFDVPMPDDRPESPEERLRELNGQIAAVAGRLRCSDDEAVRGEGDRIAAAVKEVRAALSTPAGPSPEEK